MLPRICPDMLRKGQTAACNGTDSKACGCSHLQHYANNFTAKPIKISQHSLSDLGSKKQAIESVVDESTRKTQQTEPESCLNATAELSCQVYSSCRSCLVNFAVSTARVS